MICDWKYNWRLEHLFWFDLNCNISSCFPFLYISTHNMCCFVSTNWFPIFIFFFPWAWSRYFFRYFSTNSLLFSPPFIFSISICFFLLSVFSTQNFLHLEKYFFCFVYLFIVSCTSGKEVVKKKNESSMLFGLKFRDVNLDSSLSQNAAFIFVIFKGLDINF